MLVYLFIGYAQNILTDKLRKTLFPCNCQLDILKRFCKNKCQMKLHLLPSVVYLDLTLQVDSAESNLLSHTLCFTMHVGEHTLALHVVHYLITCSNPCQIYSRPMNQYLLGIDHCTSGPKSKCIRIQNQEEIENISKFKLLLSILKVCFISSLWCIFFLIIDILHPNNNSISSLFSCIIIIKDQLLDYLCNICPMLIRECTNC